MIGDAFFGWKKIIKGLQLGFSQMGLVAVKVFEAIFTAFKKVTIGLAKAIITLQSEAQKLPGFVDTFGTGINVTQVIKGLRITEKLFENSVQAMKDVVEDNERELVELLNKGNFSERLRKQFEDLNRDGLIPLISTWDDYLNILEQTERKTRKLTNATGAINDQFRKIFGADATLDKKGPAFGGISLGFESQQLVGLGLEKDKLQEKFDLFKEASDKEVELTQEVQDKKLEIIKAFNDELRALQLAQAQIILGSASGMFDDLANISESFAGRQSGIFKAMFAVSKAFAIAESTVKIAQGIANAAGTPFPFNIAAMAQVAAATAGIVSSIQSVQLEFGGARARGGPVTPDKAFLVGERGPEPFIPSSAGTILPNSALGGGKVNVVVNNFTDAQAEVRETTNGNERNVEIIIARTKNSIASDVRQGTGDINRSLQSSFGLKRAGR